MAYRDVSGTAHNEFNLELGMYLQYWLLQSEHDTTLL